MRMQKQFTMKSFLIPVMIFIFVLISAGCVADEKENESLNFGLNETDFKKTTLPVYLITPDEGVMCYGNQAVFRELDVNDKSPDVNLNYSIGFISVESKNQTIPHRLSKRSEYIFVNHGEAEILTGNSTLYAKAGESVIIPKDSLQSIKSSGNNVLSYLSIISPAYTDESVISKDRLSEFQIAEDKTPVKINYPKEGILWDIGSDIMIYSIANPVLMPESDIPFEYSVAYAQILPRGAADENYLKGSSELICVIKGEIEVYAPGQNPVLVTAGNAAYIPAGQAKGYRNSGAVNAELLSITDPAWTVENWAVV